jgi:ABC-2 type transport system permease protein
MNPALTLDTAMPRRRLLRAYLMEGRYEFLRMLRSPGFSVPFLLLPAGLYLLFGALLYGNEIAKDPKAALFVFLGFSVFGVIGPGMFGFGVTVAMEREQGLMKLKRAMPCPPGAALLAKMIMSTLFVIMIVVTMDAAAPLGHLRLAAGQMVVLSMVNIVGSLPFCALGLFIGTLASAKSAPAVINLLYLPMVYLSEILFNLPASMKWIAMLSPAYHLVQAARAAIGVASEGNPAVHVAFLAATTLIFTLLAIRRLERVG